MTVSAADTHRAIHFRIKKTDLDRSAPPVVFARIVTDLSESIVSPRAAVVRNLGSVVLDLDNFLDRAAIFGDATSTSFEATVVSTNVL